MSVNLIEILKNAVSDKVIDVLGKQVGLGSTETKSGISAIIPTVLAGILGKHGTESASPSWMGLISHLGGNKENEIDTDNLDFASIKEKGKNVVENLFGKHTDSVSNAIAQASGIAKDKAESLLTTASPLLLGFLSKWMNVKNWSFSHLIANLHENKVNLLSALPAGIASLGFLGGEIPKFNMNTKKPNTGWIKWLLLVILIGALLWIILGRSCEGCQQKVTATDSLKTNADSSAGVIKGKLNETGDWVANLGDTIKLNLANDTVLTVGQNSAENNLVKFIEDKNKPVDKTTWFSLDRLFFESGSSTLKVESKQQLKNIAEIMKAYPNVKLKMGGYTDNTGTDAVNLKVSTERAKAAMAALVKLGVPANRLEAEGYGSQYPVCAANNTPECKAQNRRIDVRVTAK